ncbi:MAG: dethiobiotin synthase [Pontiellaceae bacterium]|nr:dethiobiotin synthase [Pontiellaceae bacterium]MBN2784936.1 dethiobiotin synthase [Pontiellaceae bacterium]
MNGLFITGTDTDVGKTALSALLLAELRRRRINAAPIKPAQTGCNRNVPDLDYSLSMAGMQVDSETYRNMAPYTFEPACSPHLAAEMAGTEIDIAEMVIAARTLAADYEFILAEGAGGIMVPLNRRETTLDLMQALRFPVLIAAQPGLGTINHTLLSIQALRSDGLKIAGVVFVNSTNAPEDFMIEDNAATIEQFGKVPILGTIPYCSGLTGPAPSYENLPLPVVAAIEKIVNRLTL